MSRAKLKAENQQLVRKLNRDGFRIAQQFGLQYRCIEAERANVKNRYGICYSDGTIRIRLRHVTTRKPLKYSSLIDTLCHELAHLRHFDHSQRFHRFYDEVLAFARRQGIYAPGKGPAPARPAVARPPTPWERAPARSGPAFESDLLYARRNPHAPNTRAGPLPTSEGANEAPQKPEQLSLFV